MTAWNPQATVTIGGTDYTDDALEGLTLTLGRQDQSQQPQAGYGSVVLVDVTGAGFPLNIADTAVVTVKDNSNVTHTIFTGVISDIAVSIEQSGSGGVVCVHTLTVVGPLARLNRQIVGAAGYPAENDGDRVAEILTEALAAQWQDVPATQTWATTNASLTYATYDPLIGTVDQPGIYELAAYASGDASAYQLAAAAAANGLGVIYESTTGQVGYADADRRQDDAATNGFLTLTNSDILGAGVAATQRIGDVVNKLDLSWASGTVAVQDDTSIGAYGVFASQIDTDLNLLADATEQANRYLTLFGDPRITLEALSIAVDNPNITSATRTALIDVYVGKPIRVTNLPAAITADDFLGFCEGWTWQINHQAALLQMYVSDYALSAIDARWQNVNPTLTWASTNAGIEWQEAVVIY